MCCWCLKVFLRVSVNLSRRIVADFVDSWYTMCSFWCGRNYRGAPVEQLHVPAGDFEPAVEELYKEVDREGAEKLLANKQNGTFLIRPSDFNIGTLSVIQDGNVFHLNIRRRGCDRLYALGTEKPNEKAFPDLNNLINYYVSNYLVLYSQSHGQTARTLLIPFGQYGPP